MYKIYALKLKEKIGLLMLVAFFGLINTAMAQSSANYIFTTNNTGSLTVDGNADAIDMTTGTTQLIGAGLDAAASPLTNIGFEFYLMGNRFTQFGAQEDGIVQLGSVPGTNVYTITGGTATAPRLSAFNADLKTGTTTGKVHYKVVGSAPNRVLVIEFKEMQLFYATSAAGTSTYQVRLYETKGTVEYVYGTMSATDVATSNRAPSIGFYTGSGTGAFASVLYATQTASTTTPYAANPNVAAVGPIAELTSSADGSRRFYKFTPPQITVAPTALTFPSAAATSITLNWVEPTSVTGIVKYAVYNSTDGITYNLVNTVNVGTTTLTATGLTINTNYFWKVYAISEGSIGTTALSGTQSTAATAATYYWVGTGGADFNTGTNWNTSATGSGTARTTPDATDVLIVDGDGTTAGAATTLNLSANQTVGVFRISNSTAVTLQSSSTTTRTLTIAGGAGDDLDVPAGSSLIMNNAANAAAIAFSGTGNTGNTAGTITLGGTSSNVITTTGGTGTIVTIQATGTVNLTAASATAVLVGSTSSLVFANGSSCNVSGFTTTNAFIPTATWGATSNVTLNGGTTGTGITTSSTSFGNFIFNSTTLTATLSAFTSSTITIQGGLTIQATNTGTFRPLSSGTLTILGNLIINGGTLDIASGSGTVKLAGNLIQNGGTLNASGASSSLEFNGTAAQNALVGTIGTGTLNVRINNPANVSLTGTLSINAGATLTVSNGNLTGSGTVTYGTTGKLAYNSTTGAQTASALEFPAANGPASLTINNTATSPNNTVSIPFSRTLGTSGVLALTAGILNNTGNVITISNTATGGITGGSATSYVKGAVVRTLPASLATGSTYLFPVGKGSYNQVELVNPTTGAGGTVTISAETFDAASGGTAGASIGTINTNRYWAISTTAGAANLTNTALRLYDAPGTADGIAGSSTQAGAYALVGGVSPTATATSITTVNPALTTLLGYYVMGKRAVPVISNLAITPSTTQCTNVQRSVTVTVAPGAAAISSVAINYSINGTAQGPISMSNSGGNNWTGVIPTVSPTNANVTWSVVATDANSLTATQAGTSYSDDPLLGATANLSASRTTVCAGNPTTLTAAILKPGISQSIGAGTTLTGDNDDVTAFGNRWPTFRMQLLYTASELTAAGLGAGPISAITFKINTLGSGAGNTNYVVTIGATTATALTGYAANGTFATVFSAASYTHAIGLNTLTFTTPYNWDGTSNIILEFNYSGLDLSNNAQTYYTTTTVNTVAAAHSGAAAASSTNRPNIIFTGTSSVPVSTYSFSNGTSVVGTTNPLTLNVNNTTTYTANLTISGCAASTNAVTVTSTPLPTAPTATNSTQCGAGIPTASVASSAGASGSGTFLWYDAPTGGNLVQGAAYGALTNYYTNDFSTASLGTATSSGNAAVTSGAMVLTPATTSQQGGFTIPASGGNSNQYKVDLDLAVTATGTTIADGFSYSFGDDALATATSPSAEHGSGSKLRVSFDTYDAASGTNGMGIYVMYNAPTSGTDAYSATSTGVLAYLPNVSWVPTAAATTTSHVTVSINAASQLTLTLAGTPIITNLQLPAAFSTTDKSTWKHVFSARSGGIAGGFAIDNLAIQANGPAPGYTTYQSSIPAATTFYVSEMGTSGCESPRTPVAVTFTSNPLNAVASPASITCLGGSTSLSVSQTGNTNNYSLTWTASPVTGSGLPTSAAGSLSTPITVTPTVGGTYTYTITGTDGTCVSIDTVKVIANDPTTAATIIAAATPSTICAGSATSLTMQVYTSFTSEGFETFPLTSFVTASVSGTASATQNTTYFNSGASSVLFNTPSTGADVSLSSAADINLTSTPGAILTFSQIACLESYSGADDYGYVQYSTNGGSTWTTFPASSYLGAGTLVGTGVGFSASSYTDWVSAFSAGSTSLPNNGLWKKESISIPASALTANFRIRFRHTTDGSVFYYGWLIDDVSIKTTPSTQTYSWSNGSTTVGTTNPLVQNPTANTNYTCATTVLGCPVTSSVLPVTVNALPALATTGTSGNNTQGAGSTYLYTDGSCDLIAGVTTAGNSLGAVTATVTVDASVQNNAGVPYLQRHYVITPATNGPATVKLYATQAEFTAYNTAAGVNYPAMPTTGSNSDPNIGNIRITKYDGTPFVNGTLLTPTAVNWNAAKNWWEITVNTPNFSTFYIHTGSNLPLEIHLLTFTGVNEGTRNRLDWTSASEHAGDKFTVQRSIDNHTFVDLGTVLANGKGVYQFYDEKPIAGTNLYRLLMSDAKGTEDYSEVVALKVRDASNFVVEAFPNPTKDQVNIKVNGQQGANAQITLTDVSGRIIKHESFAGNAATVDMQGIANGVYLLRYTDDSHNQTIKINKQ
jgi:hypothetical protein